MRLLLLFILLILTPLTYVFLRRMRFLTSESPNSKRSLATRSNGEPGRRLPPWNRCSNQSSHGAPWYDLAAQTGSVEALYSASALFGCAVPAWRHLVIHGLDEAEALQRAQIAILRSVVVRDVKLTARGASSAEEEAASAPATGTVTTRHPYHWFQ